MKYNQLGRTGLFVSELCLGTMTFGTWDAIGDVMGGLQQGPAEELIQTAMQAGVNFIDTADIYSAGNSERIVGKALKNLGVKRSDLVLATKGYGATGPGPNDRGASRAHLMDAVQASLERLGVDHIDLYQVHGFDSVTALEETVRALDDLVRQGLVRYVGCSNARAWQLMKAVGLAEQRGWARFECVQSYYTLAARDLEREMVSLLDDQRLGLLVWSPLAGGLLSGKQLRDGAVPTGTRRAAMEFPPVDRERAFDCVDAMRPMAASRGVSVAQIALAWLLHQRHVTSVILGAKNLAQLQDNLAATAVELSTDELATLDSVSALPLEYPGWMFPFFVDPQRTQEAQKAAEAAYAR